jgi:pimeloyl-ACP methyl ester carboxylesterase
MPLLHHIVSGVDGVPLVFVHGFGCAHTDWDAQVAHFSPRHRTVAVDLRGHGQSHGTAEECSIERYGADVAEVMRALALSPAVVVGHSMGCRVAVEAVLQAPAFAKALVLVDGSQFSPAMEPVLKSRLATEDGYAAFTAGLFRDMFGARSDKAVAATIIARASRLPWPVGEKMLNDMLRYDVWRLTASLASVRVPVMALQTTYSNERRERVSMRLGQTTPYLDMLRETVAAVRIDVIEDTGHFPQIEESAQTNALIESFVASLEG